MLLILLPIILVLGVIFLLNFLVARMYKNRQEPHSSTPAEYEIPFTEIRIPLNGDKHLYGWWIPTNPNAPTIILLHGWGRNLSRTLKYIRELHPLGYNLLAFDARNHGSSASEKHPTVWTFTEDIQSVMKFVATYGWVSTNYIGIIGLSIGGGAAINAAGLDHNIKSIITVGAISHPYAVMKTEFDKRGIPEILPKLFFKYMQIRFGINFNKIAPINNIKTAQADILLIHGDQDATVPLAQGQALNESSRNGTASLWVVPGKGHSDCETHEEFWGRVEKFLKQTLPVSGSAH